MKRGLTYSNPLPEEPFFPGQEQLPADAVQQVMALSRSLYRSLAAAFAALQDWRLHFNHLFPRAKGYSPHHCPACGLIARGSELLLMHREHIGVFVGRMLRDPAQNEHFKAAVRLYAWVEVQFSKQLGLARSMDEQLARAARLLHALIPERFVEGQWADELGEETPLLFPLDEAMITCVQEFAAAYSSLVLAFDSWRAANPDRCPALFAWVEAGNE